MKSEITRVEIPLYIRQIELSKARMATYYEMVKTKKGSKIKGGKKIPLKYQTKDYKFLSILKGKRTRLLLCDKLGIPVVSNPLAQGTPRIYTINGQDLYNSNIRTHTRNKIVTAIKKNFEPYLLKMEPIPDEYYPIRIELELHDMFLDPISRNNDWDVDNRANGWYCKCFQDLLKAQGKIKDDHRRFITGPPAALFCPVDKPEDRKLVFIIYRDTRPEILNNEYYKTPIK